MSRIAKSKESRTGMVPASKYAVSSKSLCKMHTMKTLLPDLNFRQKQTYFSIASFQNLFEVHTLRYKHIYIYDIYSEIMANRMIFI